MEVEVGLTKWVRLEAKFLFLQLEEELQAPLR